MLRRRDAARSCSTRCEDAERGLAAAGGDRRPRRRGAGTARCSVVPEGHRGLVGALGDPARDQRADPARRPRRHHPGNHRRRHHVRTDGRAGGLGEPTAWVEPWKRRLSRKGRANQQRTARRETADGPVELFYEDLGDPDDPPVLLIMGLGAQLPMWPDGFCAQLVDAGLPGHPVRPPRHRAVGQDARAAARRLGVSTGGALSGGPPQPGALHAGRHDRGRGSAARSPRHRARARGRRLDGRHDRADPGRHRARPGRIAGHHHVDHRQAVLRAAGLAGDQAGVRPARRTTRRRRRSWPSRCATSRCSTAPTSCRPTTSCAAGPAARGPLRLPARHAAPVRRRPGHRQPAGYSKAITAPTVVLHGSDDPMVRPRNGRAVAAAIPGARFVVVDGMGHDLPEPVWRPIVETLTENFALARRP